MDNDGREELEIIKIAHHGPSSAFRISLTFPCPGRRP
jgi:hypothetical protein